MILYHGTDSASAEDIFQRGIIISRGNERADFGQGFYTTPNKEMTKKWASRKGFLSRGAIVSFQFDEDGISNEINVLRFLSADLQWAQFVANNRNGYNYARKMSFATDNLRAQFDIVIGPTADGDVANITRRLQAECAPVSNLVLSEFTQKTLSVQYSFHSSKSIQLLRSPRIQLI